MDRQSLDLRRLTRFGSCEKPLVIQSDDCLDPPLRVNFEEPLDKLDRTGSNFLPLLSLEVELPALQTLLDEG